MTNSASHFWYLHTQTKKEKNKKERQTCPITYIFIYFQRSGIIAKRKYTVWICFMVMYIYFLFIFATHNQLKKASYVFPYWLICAFQHNLRLLVIFFSFVPFFNRIISKNKEIKICTSPNTSETYLVFNILEL